MLGIRLRIWVFAALATAGLTAAVSSWAPSPRAPSEPLPPPAETPREPRPARVQEPALVSRAAPEDPRPDRRPTSNVEAGAERFGTPRQMTPVELELQERVRERARELGIEIPPDVRDAIDDLEPWPGEDEPAFADRLRDVERDALEDEFLTESALWQRYNSELYRVGEPTSHHRAEASQRVSQMTPKEREHLLEWALGQVDLPKQPHFWPESQAAPYEGPEAEEPPEGFRWVVDPELDAKPIQ